MKTFDRNEIESILDRKHWDTVNRWLQRGDGIAVYQNVALDSAGLGHRQFVSFGSAAAQIETSEPPQRLPDIGNAINWKYQLEGVYRGAALA